MENTKRHFDLTPEDEGILQAIVRFLIQRDGRANRADAIRYALRKAVKGLPK